MRIGFIARPIEDDFEFAALKEFPCLELNFDEDLTALDRTHDVNLWRRKYEVDISSVGLFGRNYLADDATEREAHLAALRRVTDYARAVGAPILTLGGGLNPALSLEQSCARAVEVLGPAVQYAEGLGLKVAFYNCHWANFITSAESWGPILTAFPNAGIKFDPSHPVYDGLDWAPQLAAWGHRVYHTHAKDTLFVDGKPFEDVPAGLGDTHWGRFFALLYHHGYRGDINIEPHSKTWDRGEMFYCGILLARQHLEQFITPTATATAADLQAR